MYVDKRRVKTHALQVIIGNTQLYGGAIKYTWQAQCDDGLLDICIVRRQSMYRRPLVLLDFLLHREQRRQWVRYEKCTQVKVRTRHPVAIQIDGDPMGYTAQGYPPTTINIVPGALKVLVPQNTPDGLFSQSS
jgi:diacylglycerol kinase (ATP)